MSLSNLTSLMESNCKVNGDKEDYFDLLGFRDEVIDKIFSFLDPEERMKMRLNRRLNKIEADSKYYMERVELKQSYHDESKCVTIKDHEYPFDFISRIAHRTYIGELQIEFPDSIEVAREFFNIIKEFRCIRELWINELSYWMAEIMTDSFFLDLSNRCESLHLGNATSNFSHANLHSVYKIIVDDSTSFHCFKIHTLNMKTVRAFLNLLGISYRNGGVSSNRDIEAYKSSTEDLEDEYYVNIHDGCARIIFAWPDDTPDDAPFEFSSFSESSTDEEDENDWGTIVEDPYEADDWHNTSIEITFHKNQMAFNRFKYNTSLMERKCNGDFFDLLGFPDEVISQFFSFLDPKERIRMRLNRRLNKIEAESKYYLEKVKLKEFNRRYSRRRGRNYASIKGRHYHLDFIRRIAHSTSVGRLEIDFPFDDDLGLEFCNVAKDFGCIGEISICFMDGGHPYKILTNSFFLDISRNCESVNINHKYIAPVSPMALHNMYKSMRDGSASIRHIYISEIAQDTRNSFLKLLGITYNNGRVISNRNIEAYKDTYYYLDQDFNEKVNYYDIHIFDGFSHISFVASEGEEDYNDYDEDEDWNSNGPPITIELLKNQEALNSAKNPPPEEGCRRVRMDVYPE